MYFLMKYLHHPGMDDRRDEMRPLHREWVRNGGEGLAVVLVGSALVDDGGASIGNFGLLSAKDEASARAFAEGDPFNAAGIVRAIEITRLADSFQAHRIPDPMTVLS